MSQDIFVVIEHLRGQVADISYVMLAAARYLAEGTGGKVFGVLLGSGAQDLSNDLAADGVLYADHSALSDFTADAYCVVLAKLITDQSPRAVLFGHTTIGAETAGVLSAKLSLPLVSSCRTLTGDGKFVCEICGGKIMVEGDLPAPTALISMVPGGYKAAQGRGTQPPMLETITVPSLDDLRVTLRCYVEPEAGDVDIAREPLLISVGRGIQSQANIEMASDLAAAMGGTVCASRPVVDQGWMPQSRLVGKSGKHVKPKVYLALGISGAPEHVEGMAESDTIIAVNTDPNAPIFSIAKYGTTVDLFDLVPVLIEKIRQPSVAK